MKRKKEFLYRMTILICMVVVLIIIPVTKASGVDVSDIKERGVLRHLGVPYANFVTGSGDGMDVELVQLFAQHLGVKYEYVETSWGAVIGDLTGEKVKPRGKDIEITGNVPVKGDIVANGFTILPWRQKVVFYSIPTFPTQVWIITRADSPIKPIKPGDNIHKDIAAVKALLNGRTILGVANTCLDPDLYGLEEAGARIKLFYGNLNELAPAVINCDAETTLLDVPDALIALEKWPGKIKILGPVSPMQNMACAFAKTSGDLRDVFNKFFEQCREDGTYMRLVKKYYPAVFRYYPEFFKKKDRKG
ncbi:MAG: transporter substrate-binding domain-containing protein [Syntrophales bacterium]|nr:transporter substrate-binding domain-containing protein [Syntrophales bacterium]